MNILLESSLTVSLPDSSSEPKTSPKLILLKFSFSRAEIPSSFSSKPSQRRNRYKKALITPEEARQNRQQAEQARRNRQRSNFTIQPVFSSFYAGSAHRLHRRDLPPPPRGWKELQKHPNKQEFMQACDQKWETLSNMKILKIIERYKASTKPLPLTWVFTYKFDKHGFLQKFKARICVRGDLQPTSEKDIYAATLAARSFRMLIALAAR